MMGDTGTAPGAFQNWLAKVLAGDRLACGLLDLARSLPADEWEAFARDIERVTARAPADCGPVRLAGAS